MNLHNTMAELIRSCKYGSLVQHIIRIYDLTVLFQTAPFTKYNQVVS